jgi:hypothetical protein
LTRARIVRAVPPMAVALAVAAAIGWGSLGTAAYAGTILTLNPATVTGSDFSWSCDVNPGGTTSYVAGASWVTAGGGDFVETARVAVSGSATSTVHFTRDGAPNVAYQYRCKAYPVSTGGTATLSAKADVTTVGDTRYGDIVSTVNEGIPYTRANFITLYNSHRAQFGGATPLGVRLYSSDEVPVPTDPSPSVTEQIMAWVATNHPDESITVSFKSYNGGRLASLLSWAQANTVDLTVIYYHEPQENWGKQSPPDPGADPTYYKSVYAQMRTVINAHPWKSHTTLEKNLMWYWQAIQVPIYGVDWHVYVLPKNADGSKADPADRLSWDAYTPLEWSRYATPAEFMTYALAAWNDSAIPWGYGEIGALPKTTPGDAAWVAATRAYADAARTPSLAGPAFAALPPAQTFKYWDAHHNLDAHGNPVGDYDLSQNPAAVAMYTPFLVGAPLSG